MKKLLIVIHSLSGGGAERVVSRMLQHLSTHHPDLELHLALLKPKIDYELPASVTVHILGKPENGIPAKILGQMRTFLNLRKLMSKLQPTSVLSFMPTANLYSIAAKMSLIRCSSDVVISERVALEANYKGWHKVLLFALMRFFYPRASNVVCVAEGIAREFAVRGISLKKVTVINNSVDAEELQIKAELRPKHEWTQSKNAPLIVTAGRLTHQKGQDILIEAAKLLHEEGMPVKVCVFGTGDLESVLAKQVNDANLSDYVKFMGFNANPYPEISNATCFAFPSRWEGFPNALLEAMALGTPVVAADCPFGSSELLVNGAYGELVPVDNPRAFADALRHQIEACSTAEGLRHARNRSYAGAARYTPENMIAQYLQVLSLN